MAGSPSVLVNQPYGSALLFLNTENDMGPVFSPSGSNAVLLGCDKDDPNKGMAWMPESLGHGLTFGATRSGKGTCAIIPALLTYAASCVVIDPKGENAWVTIPRRRALGNRVVLLDPWDEVNRRYGEGQQVEERTRFNPLAALDPASPNFAEDVAGIADALIVDDGGESHWTSSAREMLSGLVAAMVESNPGRATLSQVRDVLMMSQERFAEAIAVFQEMNPKGLGSRKLDGYKLASREVDSIRSVARTQTGFLDSASLTAGMESDAAPFDLAELVTGQVTLYLVLPVDRLKTHGRWLRLILTLAIQAISRQPEQPPQPVLFLLDEMGTIGRLAMVEQAFGLMAGLGIRLWGFLQDLSQAKRDYPETWETFIANSTFIQILSAKDQTTCQYFSEYIGLGTVEQLTLETQRFRSGKNLALRKDPNWSNPDDKHFGRPVLYADEIRKIASHHCLVMFTDNNPVYVRKVSYYADHRLAQFQRVLPKFRGIAPPVAPPPEPPKKKGFFG